MLALTLESVSGGFSDVLAHDLSPQRIQGAPSLPIQLLHQHGTDHVVAVLDFHQEHDVAALDNLWREVPGA